MMPSASKPDSSKPSLRVSKTMRRLLGAGAVAVALGGLVYGVHSAQAAVQPTETAIRRGAARPDTDEQRIADLVIANHIMANEGVMDGLGHISVRSVSNPNHYFMSRSRSAGSITRADIMEFDLDSKPIDQRGRDMYGERFIHGEVYKARPDVQAVLHSHTDAVVPFSITDVPFRAVMHMAAFIGIDPVPNFEIRDVEGDQNRMLVSNSRSGAALAKALGDRNMVLMRGHGMTVIADKYPGGPARWIADRSYYVNVNAKILSETLKLGRPIKGLNQYEADFRAGSLDRWWEDYSARAAASSHVAAAR